jgi:hypothetical protein
MTRKDRIVYWATTGIVAAVMTYSILNFTVFDRFPFPEGGFVHLGLPRYFKVELTTAKILGVLALLIPGVPAKIKEFVLDPLVFLCLLAVSYVYFNKAAAMARHPPRPTGN